MSAEIYPQGLPKTAEEALEAVLKIANEILRRCKLFSLDSLKGESPTVKEIALSMKVVCSIVEKLGFEGDLQLEKAREYVHHVQAIACAIEDEDEDELKRQVIELNKRSFIL